MRYLSFLIILTNLVFTNVAFANISNIKIGVVDSKILLKESPQAKKIRKSLELEFGARKENLLSLENNLKEKHSKLQRDKDILTDAEMKKQEREINHMQQNFYRDSQEFQADVAARQQQEQEKFAKIVDAVVNKIATKEKLDLVLPKQVSVYTGKKIDITDKVLSDMKNKP